MSLVSRYEFQKCVDRYKGDWRIRSFTCFDQFKVMSFAQFTDRSGLRDIEMTLEFCGKDLYHAGLCSVPKSTLAGANEKRNWMIYRDFAQTLIKEAKSLYRDDYFRLGLKGKNPSVEYSEPLRMVVYEDYSTDNVYRFITNNLDIDSLTVAELYRERWMVELFFKWVKQHLHIKKFYGTSENAVYLQLWIAVCDYLLLIIAKKKFCLPQSLHTISNAIGPLLFKQSDIHSIFNVTKEINNNRSDNQPIQLSLW